MQKRPWRRKQLIINNFQYRLMIFHLAQFAAVVLFVMGAIYAPLMLKLDRSSLSELQKLEVSNQLIGVNSMLLPTLWIVFGLIIIHSVIVSHRIAGPIYRIRNILKAITGGDLTQRLTLRKHDYLMGDAEVVNDMIESLSGKIREMENRHRRMDATLTSVMTSAAGVTGEAGAKLEELRAEIDEWKIALDHFEVSPPSASVEEMPSRDHTPVGA